MANSKLYKFLRKDSAQAIGYKYSGVLLSFLLQAAILKSTSTEVYGSYVQVLALANILGTLCSFGQMTYLTKSVAISLADQLHVKAVLNVVRAVVIVLLSIGIVSLASYVCIYFLEALNLTIGIVQYKQLPLLLVLSFAIAFQRLMTGFARGSGQAVRELALNHLLKPALQLALLYIAVIVLSGPNVKPEILVLILTAATLGVILLQSLSLYLFHKDSFDRSSRIKNTFGVKRKEIIEQFKHSLVFTGMSLITVLEKSADVLIVGITLGATEAGVYGFVTRLYRISVAAQTSLNSVFASKAARDHAKGDLESFSELGRNITLINVFGSIIFLIFFIFAGQFVLARVDSDLVVGWWPLLILGFSGLIRSAAGPVSMTANMVGAEKAAIKVTITSLLMGVTMMFFATTWFGIVGTAVSAGFMAVSRAWMLRRMLSKHLSSNFSVKQ